MISRRDGQITWTDDFNNLALIPSNPDVISLWVFPVFMLVGKDPPVGCPIRALTCFQRNELFLFSAIYLANNSLLAFRIRELVLFLHVLYSCQFLCL